MLGHLQKQIKQNYTLKAFAMQKRQFILPVLPFLIIRRYFWIDGDI